MITSNFAKTAADYDRKLVVSIFNGDAPATITHHLAGKRPHGSEGRQRVAASRGGVMSNVSLTKITTAKRTSSKGKRCQLHGLRTYAYPQQRWTIDMKCELNQAITYEDICRTIQSLAEDGMIVDSGSKRWSKRTGRYEVVWLLSPVARNKATKSITPYLSL